jgi:streptomycin 6-kinase
MNVGWDHLGASPDAYVRVNPTPPPFADCHVVAGLLQVDYESIVIENVWFIPGRSLTVVYSSGHERFVVDYGHTVSVRAMVDDTKLAALPLLLDQQRASERVGAEVEVRVLSYLPGERCAVRYRGENVDVVAKISRREDMRVCDRRQRSLFELPGRQFTMAEPLGVDAQGIRLERAVAGYRAEELMPSTSPTMLMCAMADALPPLHAAPTAGRPALGATEVLTRMQDKVVQRIATALPRLALRLDSVCTKLAETRPPDIAPVAIHGDLHTANVLFDDALQPAFIDLDNLAVGDAEYDLALFASRLRLHGVLTNTPTVVPTEYGSEDTARFRWYLAATLVGRQMKTCVRHLAPDLSRHCETLLSEAEALCR